VGGWFRRRPPETPAPGPLPAGDGRCHFLDAWRFAIAEGDRYPVDADRHDGPLRIVQFRRAGGGPPAPFEICRAHAEEFVRFMMRTGITPVTR